MINCTLILEGGAKRGVFTAGVIDYFIENKFIVSDVLGVSAGACNAVDYVSQQFGRSRDCIIAEKEDAKYINFGNLIKSKKPVIDIDKAIAEFAFYQYPFDFENYMQSSIRCHLVTTNIQTGQAEYLDDRNNVERLVQILKASSSIPIFSHIVNFDDKQYLDGGISDGIPLDYALGLGNQKIIVILTRSKDAAYLKENRFENRVIDRTFKNYPQLIKAMKQRVTNYNRVVARLEALEAEGKIFIIRPLTMSVKTSTNQKAVLMSYYQEGYQLAKALQPALNNYLNK